MFSNGYVFLARQVLASKRLLMCAASLELAQQLVYTLNLLTQSDPLQVFWFREAQPLFPYYNEEVKQIEASARPCVILCDVDVISYRQYIHLLIDPNCIIIVVTDLLHHAVPVLYRNSCRCILNCSWHWSFFKNVDDRFGCELVLHRPTFLVEDCVTRMQVKFRRRYSMLLLLQRALKSWLYRPGSAYALKTIASCKQKMENKTF